MAERIKLKVSSTVAAYVSPAATVDDKLRGVLEAATFSPGDQLTLLFCLMSDKHEMVKRAAVASFDCLAEGRLLEMLDIADLHPGMVNVIVRTHHGISAVANKVRSHPALSPVAGAFLGTLEDTCAESVEAECVAKESNEDKDTWDDDSPEGNGECEEEASAEADDEYLSKYQMIQEMGISEKIKMALTGDKEWRAILINDNNKLVSGSVIKNPRITEGEILKILKVGVQNDEIVRLICANREWVKNYMIRKALVDCPKTPLPLALRFIASLNDKDIAGYAKSKNISTVISTHAKRMILAKKR